jgi:hypothetical protein
MRPPTEAASPVVTDGYGSTSTMYRRIVFWTDLTFSRRSQHAYAVKQKGSVSWMALVGLILGTVLAIILWLVWFYG